MPPSNSQITRDEAFAIGRLDATAQAALVASGDLAPQELVEAAMIRIEALDPQLNAITQFHPEARERAIRAEGPMAGVPWMVKDGFDYPGIPTRSGSRTLRDAAPSTADAWPYAGRLDASGLVMLGKTNAPEFGLLPTTEPLAYGPARNPWNPQRSPGGSSGGAAVAVASGMVPVAHAADGGGSIRIPASHCGLVGLKPGRAAHVRARPQHIIEDMLVADTLLSRSVRDVRWATEITSAMPSCDIGPIAPLRIALIEQSLDGTAPKPEVKAALDAAAGLCESLGHLVEQRPLPVDGTATAAAFRTIWGYLARDAMRDAQSRFGSHAAALVEPWTANLAQWAVDIDVADVDRLLRTIMQAERALEAFFTGYDLILSPVLRRPALAIGELAPDRPLDEMMTLMFDYVSYTPLHNLTGLPAITLPLGFHDRHGVPIGPMFAAARGGEALLLAFAAQLEEAAPWTNRWPAISVGNRAFQA